MKADLIDNSGLTARACVAGAVALLLGAAALVLVFTLGN